MASELFDKMGPGQSPVQQNQQNPKEAALNLLRQQGFTITKEQENDPNALMRMVLNSGSVYQNRLPMAQNMLMRFMGRR